MSQFGFPYRAPCGGWPGTPRRYRGGCYQHRRASEGHIQHWENTTRTTADGNPPPGTQYSAWSPADFAACVGTPVDLNCYALQDGIFDDLSRCRKRGSKFAQARKVWHGRYGWTSHDPSGCSVDISGTHAAVMWEEYQPSHSSTKYLRLTANASFRVEGWPALSNNYDYSDTASEDSTDHDNRVVAVNRTSGIMSQACDQSSGSNLSNATGALTYYGDTIGPCFLVSLYDDWVDTAQSWASISPSTRHIAFTRSAPATMHMVVTDDVEGITAYDMAVDLNGGTFDATAWMRVHPYSPPTETGDPGPDLSFTAVSKDTHAVVGETGLSFTNVDSENLAEQKRNSTTIVTATLDMPYAEADVNADVIGLLAHWPLDDDKMYPWRTDGYVTIAPLVTFDENPSQQLPNFSHDCTWTDPGTWTGAVIGGPNPAGYAAHFDWRHQELPFSDCVGYTSYGMWTPAFLPSNATQWTDQCTAKAFWPGAWLRYDGNALWGQKWAEIKIHRPAMNFFRPCGLDRFSADQDTVRCVTAVDGVNLTIESATSIITGDLCVVNDGAHAGVYPVTRTDATHYALGTLLWDFPADATPNANALGKVRWPSAWSICGRLAVASASAAGGTVTVELSQAATYLRTGDAVDLTDGAGAVTEANKTVTVTDSTHFTYAGSSGPTGTWAKSHGAPGYWWFDDDSKGDFLVLEWTHNFRDIGEGDRVCEQHANLAGIVAGTAYPNPDVPAGVTCNGDESTGCALRQLQGTRGMPRSVITFTVSEDCLGFSACWPQVVCFSPNGEDFDNGKTYAFPGSSTADSMGWTADSTGVTADSSSLALDGRYGSLWQGIVNFYMVDPFWQAPRPPCGSDGPWLEDEGHCGTCPDCTAGQYAHRPYVEARESVPAPWMGDSAPAYPPVLHVLSLAELAAGSQPSGIAVPPPGPVGVNIPMATDWGLWFLEVGCVCGGGVFKQDYEDDGVSVNCP